MLRPTGLMSVVIGFALLAGVAAAQADDRTDCTNTATAPANGIAACSRWIASGQLQGDDLVTAHLWRGWHLTASGEFDRAIADYSEAIKRDPKLAAAYMGRAANYEGKGELKPALADFRQALSLDPTSADATAAIKRVQEKVTALAPPRPAEPAPPPAASPPQQATAPVTPGASYLGLRVIAVPKELANELHISGGVLVKVLLDRSPAIDSDIEEGDVIVKFQRRAG